MSERTVQDAGSGARDASFAGRMVAWLNRRFAPPGVTIAAETPLFAGRLIDSIRILELIAWTERAIGREIADVEIRMDNFASVARIAEVFVNRAGCGTREAGRGSPGERKSLAAQAQRVDDVLVEGGME